MKLILPHLAPPYNWVAPYAGAWIETVLLPDSLRLLKVAPYAGAWIETKRVGKANIILFVAPYAGAWIETSYSLYIRL